MLIVAFLAAQVATSAPMTQSPQPCRLRGPRGKLIDVNPKLCEQSTWDNVRLSPAGVTATTMDLDINETGRVTDCRVVGSSGAPALDAKACSIAVAKGQYEPGINADGSPKRTTTRLKVSWPAIR